jgi:hypothetical protein
MNDLRVMRERQLVASAVLDSVVDRDTFASAALVAQTTTVATYPTTAAVFYACNPVQITGSEAEGATPNLQTDTSTVLYALNLGGQIPPIGTFLVMHAAGGRWSFRYDG